MNRGKIQDGKYIKYVNFSKAVLWKDRQLSIPPSVMSRINRNDIETMEFIDNSKQEKWIFRTADINKSMIPKVVGQEKQYYFSIDLAKKESLIKEKMTKDEREEYNYYFSQGLPIPNHLKNKE